MSALSFGIQPTFGWDSATNTYSKELTRQSDIYVFCVHKHTDQDTVNPLDIAQWDFYLLPTRILNEKAGAQKRANLASRLKMGAEKCDFEHIHARIVELIQKGKIETPALLSVAADLQPGSTQIHITVMPEILAKTSSNILRYFWHLLIHYFMYSSILCKRPIRGCIEISGCCM